MPIHVYLVVQTLGYSLGTVLFLVLVAMARRVERETPRGWIWAAAVGLWWNLSSLVNFIADKFLGCPIGSFPERLSDLSAFSATAFFPTALLVLLRQISPSRRERAFRWFQGASLAGGCGLALLMAGAKFIIGFPIRFVTLTHWSGYGFVIQLGIGLYFFRDFTPGSPYARTYARTMLLIGTVLAVLIGPLIFVRSDPGFTRLLEVLAGQVTIPMAVASLVVLGQFRYADLFVKRCLVVIAAAAFVAAYQVLVVGPLQSVVTAVPVHPEVLSFSVGVLLWCPVLLVFQAGATVLDRGIDRFVFRRPDYARLLHGWRDRIDRSLSEAEAIAGTEEMLAAAFAAQSVRIVPLAAAPEVAAVEGVTHPTTIPIRVEADAEFLLIVAPGDTGRPVLAGETAVLRRVAERLGDRLASLRLQAEKRDRELREARLRESLVEAELRALRAQVNPHFLFNTLNTIADLIGSAPERAEAMTEKLAEVFRYALAGAGKNAIPIAEEFEFLRSYLEIEAARFGDRLRVEFSLDPSLSTHLIPTLLLQPIVENAVKHGIAPKITGGTIRVSAMSEGRSIRFDVSDDGVGFGAPPTNPAAHQPRRRGQGGIGLPNIRERLRRLYGEKGRLIVSSEPGRGSTVRVELPYEM